MSIDWKDASKELPTKGSFIAALKYHWKECWPLSVEIIFGEVESWINDRGDKSLRVNTKEFTGHGLSFLEFPCNDSNNNTNIVAAWAYANEFKRPDFLRHDEYYGEEK